MPTSADRLRLGDELPLAAVAEVASVEQERDDAGGDVVEHDRRDHLVDAAGHLEHAGDRGVGRADDDRDEHDERDVDRRRQVDRGAGGGGEQRGEPVLAVDADVEQVHLEPDGDGDAGDVVRHGAVDDAARPTRSSRSSRHIALNAVDRVVAGRSAGRSTTRRSRRRRRAPAASRAPIDAHGSSASLTPAPRRGVRSAGHVRAELAPGSRSPDRARRRRAPRSITSSRSERPISSSRSAETSSTAETRRPGVAEHVPDRRLGADVDAAGRVGGDAAPSGRRHLPPDDQLLLVAARERERRRRRCPACGRRTRR